MGGMITQQQLDFLRLLSRTGFLTNGHLKQLGFGSPNSSRHFLTNRLLEGKYIGRVMIVANIGTGRKVMYFLSKKGAELLAEADSIELEDIAYTPFKGGIHTAKDGGDISLVRTDFVHKERYIALFLAFERFLGRTDYIFTQARHYYQLAGDRGTALRLQNRNFRPDGIWFLEGTMPDALPYAYVVEVHRHSDRKHIIKQLRQQVEAIKAGSVKARFGIDYPHFVLSVFADQNTAVMRGVIEELQKFPEWEYIKTFFMFARLDDLLEGDFRDGIAYFGNVKKPLPKDLTN